MLLRHLKGLDLLAFFLIGIVITFLLFWSEHTQISAKKDKLSSISSTQFNAVLHSEQKLAERFYDDHALHIASLMKKVPFANAIEKGLIREQLLDHYQGFYENARNNGLGVLHIFDHDGTSFLRFHRQDKFGDRLTGVRHSIDQLVHSQRYSQGLEVGRFKEAYRFVFPLFYDGLFIGGLEFSIDFQTLAKQLQNQFGGIHQQFLLTERLKQKLFTNQFEQYYQSSNLHPDYAIAQKHAITSSQSHPYLEKIQTSSQFQKNVDNQKAFTVFFQHNRSDIGAVFTPILDSKKIFTGYLLSINTLPTNSITHLQRQTWINVSAFWILWSLLFTFWRKNIQSQNFNRLLLDSQPTLFALSKNNHLQYANKALLNFLGYNSYQLFHNQHDCLCDLFIKEKGYLQKFMQGENWADYVIKHPNKVHKAKIEHPSTQEIHIFTLDVKPFSLDNKLYLITLHDTTQAEYKQLQLEHEIQHDPLTGTFNRRGLDLLFNEHLRSYNPVFSLVLFDIDHFKSINDNYGHDIGDLVLKELTTLVSLHLRSTDAVIRWGGEEFLVLLPNTTIEQATLIANNLKNQISRHQFTKVRSVTCSFGVSQYKKEDTKESLVKRCDQALYHAKNSGRNKVVHI
ncbi:MAG: diguanylate cyclase [Pseudomonadota bacterium]|nr:diguanylate cyclase [Pseudomonadota bacterium]